MRMATAGGAESAGRTGLAVGFHASDCAGLTPLAIILVSLPPIRSRINDDAVVAVAIGDVDASRSTGDRIPCRIHGDVRGFAQKGVTAVVRGTLVTSGVRVCSDPRAVALTLSSDLPDPRRIGPLRGGGYRIVFLNDAVTVSADPNIALVVHIAAMRTIGHIRGIPVFRRAIGVRLGLPQPAIVLPS